MSDGKEVKISKGMVALVALILMIGGAITTIAVHASKVSSVAQENKDKIKIIEPQVYENEKEIAVMREHYRNIDENINEIKTLVKKR